MSARADAGAAAVPPEGAAPDAFARLRRLIADVDPPPGLSPVHFHLGEQRLAVPSEILRTMESGDAWSYYPRLGGTPALRAAYAGWLERHFKLGPAIAAQRIALEPSPGSKQALTAAILLACARARKRHAGAPLLAIPDLGYPTYGAAAGATGAELVCYPADSDDPAAGIAEAAAGLRAPLAGIVVCRPGNPTGSVLPGAALASMAALARSHDAVLIVDECYVDLWREQRIEGALELLASPALACPTLVLHTLSKRSGAPGLRSGFIAGDPASVASYAAFNRTCGVSLSRPVCDTSAALWRDEEHVQRVRAGLVESWRVADAVLGDLPGYRRARAGFFLWLPVRDGEAAARALWQQAAVLAMPGRYLAAFGSDGPEGAEPPGRDRLRIALVHPPAILRPALERARPFLTDATPSIWSRT